MAFTVLQVEQVARKLVKIIKKPNALYFYLRVLSEPELIYWIRIS